MHLIWCMPLSINITERPVTILINFTITSDKEIRRIKVIKCPPNYNPRRDINSNVNPYLKITQIQTPTLKLQTVGLCVDLVGHFHGIYQNWACILLCVFPDISANRVLGVLKLEQPSGKCIGSIWTERAVDNQTVHPSRAESVLPEIALISVALDCKQAFCGTWTPSHTVTWSHREPVRRLIGSTDDLHLQTVRSGNQFWQMVPKEMLLPFLFNGLHITIS